MIITTGWIKTIKIEANLSSLLLLNTSWIIDWYFVSWSRNIVPSKITQFTCCCCWCIFLFFFFAIGCLCLCLSICYCEWICFVLLFAILVMKVFIICEHIVFVRGTQNGITLNFFDERGVGPQFNIHVYSTYTYNYLIYL